MYIYITSHLFIYVYVNAYNPIPPSVLHRDRGQYCIKVHKAARVAWLSMGVSHHSCLTNGTHNTQQTTYTHTCMYIYICRWIDR